jgi:hypothetical protein
MLRGQKPGIAKDDPKMPNYWLHVLKQESKAPSIVVAVSSFPVQDGSSIPTANYDSWDHLHNALLAVGIEACSLQNVEQSLAKEGFVTFTDVALTPDQLTTLGFGNLAELSTSASLSRR